jgi:alkylhydroperoxidase family enzyme
MSGLAQLGSRPVLLQAGRFSRSLIFQHCANADFCEPAEQQVSTVKMRISYASIAGDLSPQDQGLVDTIRTHRGQSGLLPLDHALLHSSSITSGWHKFFGALRTETRLSADVVYLAICRTALHCGADIPRVNYLSLLRQMKMMTEEMLSIIEDPRAADQGALSNKQWASLRYADAMTKHVVVSEEVFQALQAAGFDAGQIVELTAVVAGYNCVSQFLLALKVDGPAGGQG